MGAFAALEELYDAAPIAPPERLSCKQIRFNFDSHIMLPDGLPVLAEVFKHVAQDEFKHRRILLAGHTDSKGDYATNERLSNARAYNVMSVLRGQKVQFALSAFDWELNLPETQRWRDSPWNKLTARDFSSPHGPLKLKFRIRRDLFHIFRWAVSYFYADLAEANPGDYPSDIPERPDWSRSSEREKVQAWVDAWDAPPLSAAVAAFKTGVAKVSGDSKLGAGEDLGAINPKLFVAIATLYRLALCDFMEIPRSLRGYDEKAKALNWVNLDPPAVGVGENHLRYEERTDQDCFNNRRVEVLFFTTRQAPTTLDVKALGGGKKSYGIYTEFEYTDLEKCPEHTFNKVPLEPGDHVFVIDKSGSMGQNTGRLDRTKDDLIKAIRGLGMAYDRKTRPYRFAIICFGTTVGPVFEGGALHPANFLNVGKAVVFVEALKPSGYTNTYEAMETAFKLGTEAEYIYLLSDGAPTRGGQGANEGEKQREVLKLVDDEQAKRPAPVVVHTLAFGAEGYLKQFLVDLASRNGGNFTAIPEKTTP